jgi:hypothetical protein
MSTTVHSDPEAKRYSVMSGMALAFVIAAPIGTWLAFQSDVAAIRAIGVLLTPFALFCWIFTTIRALHQRAVRFWFIPSTYVAFFGGLTAVICVMIGVFFLPEYTTAGASQFTYGVQGPTLKHPGNYVMMFAAAIVQAGTTIWCLWYNWKKTEAVILAFSLTALQTFLSSGVIVVFWFRFGNGVDHEST